MDEELALPVTTGSVDLNSDKTVLEINTLMAQSTEQAFITPHIALEKVRKVLANFGVHIPGRKFLEGETGDFTVELFQFGGAIGKTADGSDLDGTENLGHFLYFEWQLNENGYFDVFAEVVTSDELEDLLSDEEDQEEE